MWKPLIIGTILATIIIFFLNSMMNSALGADTNTVSSTVVTNNTPPTANAPSVVVNNSDVCKTAVAGAVQTQILGISSGMTVRDENCERLKLSRSLYAMGMKVAAISTLCADSRVFDAMWNAGTYCPYNASIGEDAKKGWEENKDKIPEGSLIFASMKEDEKEKLKKKRKEDGKASGLEVFLALATFMLLPLL
jgi:cytochrome bd-type quinol oxidase subunit 1